MDNYDIEMWKYANKLKIKSDNKILDYEHIPNKIGIFQNKEIKINNLGLRGDEVDLSNPRKILFLGGSITLGWGVSQDETLTGLIEEKFRDNDQDIEVMNAGVGNYNTERYITSFFEKYKQFEPTDIIINYFLRDAEDLKPSKPNYLLKNSQIAVTVWTAFNRLFKNTGEQSIEEHYQRIYESNSIGYKKMIRNLEELSKYAKERNIRIYILMIPDINNLIDYKFEYIHKKIANLANQYEYIFVDSLPYFRGRSFESLYAMPGDPHPNALGHEIMAETIFPYLINKK